MRMERQALKQPAKRDLMGKASNREGTMIARVAEGSLFIRRRALKVRSKRTRKALQKGRKMVKEEANLRKHLLVTKEALNRLSTE